MILYRSVNKQNTEDYSATYTASVNGELQKTSCAYGLSGNTTFNGNIKIGNNVYNCSRLLSGCNNFNHLIEIPNSVKDCSFMFFGCSNFNQPINISNNVEDCSSMFFGCSNFNQPVNIPNKVTTCYMMFEYSGFNHDINISKSVNNIAYMLYSNYFNKNIYIQGNEFRNLNIYHMVSENSALRKNIYFNQALNNLFNIANSMSVIGRAITWTAMTNGFYNTNYNIYCYYNYSG